MARGWNEQLWTEKRLPTAAPGTLQPGGTPDFILVDRDIFAIPPEQLWQVRVLETWLGGERVYRRP